MFNDRLHDSGTKTVLGNRVPGRRRHRADRARAAECGAVPGSQAVRFFVSETAVPSDQLIEPLCDAFRKSDYDIAALVRTILGSQHFYSRHAFRGSGSRGRSSTCWGLCKRSAARTRRTTRKDGRRRSRCWSARSGRRAVAFCSAQRKGMAGG